MLVALAGSGTEARAHGGPVKVIEDRFVVTVALWPAAETTQLRFFVRDFRSGQVPAEAMSFRVRILEDRSRAVTCEGPPASVEDGEANLLCRFPREGYYEVFLQFWRDREPARVYEPEDWLVWIGGGGSAGWVSSVVVGTAAVAIVMLGVSSWRRRADGKDDA
ncbi:MAG: hypothetical protein WEG40_14540 [Candidatus Rokuibacteriota bacterium]